MNRLLLKKTLIQDYDILEAANGQEALALMHQNCKTLSAVLLDIVMPVMDGYEALSQIRSDTELTNIPVIMVTGSEDEASRVKALSLGANDFIVKPYSPEIIKHCLKNNIALRESAAMINAIQRDKMTGLYNREFFFEKASALIQAQAPGYFILFCFDIDNFKLVNDQFGALEGDRILRHIGKYVQALMDSVGGVCGRISGDNFAGLYPNRPEIVQKLTVNHAAKLLPPDIHTTLRYSIGRCVVSDPALPVSAIYDRAYMAKRAVKGRYDEHIAYFDAKMLDKLVSEQQIILEMDRALEERQFETWFQPQFNHATGALIGAEALARWRRPGQDMIQPGVFIPVFERNGFVYELDKFIWEDACRYLRKWLDEGRAPLPVSVNISRQDVYRDDFFSFLTGLLERYQLPVELLRLEVTESAFTASNEQIITVVKRLIRYGFTVEIDDFGSGYSSLNTLKDVPAQIIKLDMRFLSKGDDSQRGGNIVESIVRMARWLGMSVIAEGVETLEQADYLKSIGCSYVQGYLYAKPMPAGAYEAKCVGIGKEERLLALDTVANLNNNTFWDPKSMDTLIFNSYVGAACIFEYDNRKLELLRVNRKFTDILGNSSMSVEDTLKLDWIACLAPESLRRVREVLLRSADTADEYTDEYCFVNIPGCAPETYLRATMRVIATAGNRMLVYCTSENITAQRLAEKRERLAAAQMEGMMDDMPGGFAKLLVGEDGRVKPVYINEGFVKLTGMRRDTLVKTYADHFLDSIHPGDLNAVRACISDMLKDSEAHTLRFRQRHVSGGYVWLAVVGRATRDASGNKFLNIYFSDVSQQVKKEEAQKRLLDNLPCGVGVYELRDGQISLTYQNDSYWFMVGLNHAAFPDPAPMSAIYPDDVPLVMQELTLAMQQHRDVACDIRLRHLTLGFRPVHLAGRIVQEAAGCYAIYATFTLIGTGAAPDGAAPSGEAPNEASHT